MIGIADYVDNSLRLTLITVTLSTLLTLTNSHDTSFDAANGFLFSTDNLTATTRYLIYDVDPAEGFNLRRDVYIRVANLVKYMNGRGENWFLVLPPWRHLYHWQSRYVEQEALGWKSFFDLTNLNYYVPVLEFGEFMKLEGYHGIDHILYMQRHPQGAQQPGREVIETGRCTERFYYHLDKKNYFRGYFWNLEEVFARKHDCVSVLGHALVLADFLHTLKARSVLIERFEHLLHINHGSVDFYNARRSLVFAKHLRDVGNAFRFKYLNSNDEDDSTHYEEDWREQIPLDGHAHGGPFLGLHMRRGDFVFAHKDIVPSIEEMGEEVKKKIAEYKITKVYVATDGSDTDVQQLQSYFKAEVHRFPRTAGILNKYKDGGVAIIDQWIVSHARYFIGTCRSAFSLRVHEERDILGFKEETTFNCICGKQSPKGTCGQPARSRVKFG